MIGGGITGLAAAHALVANVERCDVVLFEATDRLGGKIRTSGFAGNAGIDEGADAFLARLPWGTALAHAVGLGAELTSPTTSRAAVWWDGLHPLPDALLLGVPTELVALARSPLLTWRGKLRAATEPFRRRTATSADSLGGFVRARFGDEIHVRLVDPLVGSIYAADTDRFSLAAVPQIAELANTARSMLLAGRKAATRPVVSPGPVFYAPRRGMSDLINACATCVTKAGGEIRLNATMTELSLDGSAWRIDGERFDAVVLASPAAVTSRLLTHAAPEAARIIETIPTADVAIVSLAIPSADWPAKLAGLSGYLVPKPRQNLVTAVSFGSQKWAHWNVGNSVILRVSLGRDGLPVLQLSDDELISAAVEEVANHLTISLQPTQVRISRWPGAFPQYRPHHAQLVDRATNTLPHGILLAGASYHGIGIPACIRSGEHAAVGVQRTLAALTD